MGGLIKKGRLMANINPLTMLATGAVGAMTNGIVRGVENAAKYAGAGQRANAVSAGAQAAAGNFNQASADNANNINTNTLAGQWANNSAGANLANNYTSESWAQTAAWNEAMFEKQMAFNAEQAQLQRDWAERMDNTKYQRAMADMKAGGLNPILAYGGINSSASGSAASVSAPEMGFAHGAQPTQGLLGANDASISGYTGQMEYYAGLMSLIGSTMNGMSSAIKSMSMMPTDLIGALGDMMNPKEWFQVEKGGFADKAYNAYNKFFKGSTTHQSSSGKYHGGSNGTFKNNHNLYEDRY